MSSNWRDRLSAVGEGHLAGGASTAVGLSVDAVHLNGGATFVPQHSGVTVLVGANNAGKSTLLREIAAKLMAQPGQSSGQGIALESIQITTEGTQADLVAWSAERLDYEEHLGARGFLIPNWGHITPGSLAMNWGHGDPGLGALAPYLMFHGDAQGRFNVGGAAEMRSSITDPATSPIHHLQDSSEMLERIRGVAERIFGQSLTLDNLGRTLRLRIGSVGVPAPPVDAISHEYLAAMAALPDLDSQGDGMRSVMGQLLPLVTASHEVVLLDEPEAFLHPPQAHALGRELGTLSSQGAQIIIATHDRNLLAGLLEVDVPITVVRLSRDGGHASVHQLNSTDLRAVWADPVLKYSNVLDGLFHRLVVVAEADGDCAYLAAALDNHGRDDPLPRSEVLFVPTGGKDGMAKVCQALRALNVPVVAAPDLDIINDVVRLSGLVRALGCVWRDELQEVWEKATADLRAPRETVKVSHVLDAVTGLLDGRQAEQYSRELRDAVSAAIRANDSPWAQVKSHGVSAFRGESYSHVLRLLELLSEAGVVPVREGELERLAPGVAVRKGSAWLGAALAAEEQNNRASQEHLDRILAAVH
ncbi:MULTISPECIES: ATP-dependent nuclease [unclassified Curtobacterium]|uniref:ATP-dependent nuclease n=1 Tax=unclassified Curtobacterium TaxID=257496 RepID=UPI0039AF463A